MNVNPASKFQENSLSAANKAPQTIPEASKSRSEPKSSHQFIRNNTNIEADETKDAVPVQSKLSQSTMPIAE